MAKKLRWTTKEENILKDVWLNKKKEDILKILPDRTWNSLILRSRKIGLNRDTTHLNVNGTKKNNFKDGVSGLHKLLEETNEAYYWAGFIAADGHISKKYRLVISLAIKDLEHLKKLEKFINSKSPTINKNNTNCTLRFQDQKIIKELADKFKFNNQKTINLCDPDIPNESLFMCFIAGFIDGDGTMQKLHKRQDCHIGIVGHSSSLRVFQKWFERLRNIFIPDQTNSNITSGLVPKIDKLGYARGIICNFEIVKKIKLYVLSLQIPYMERKWDQIDLNKQSKYVKTQERRVKIIELKKKGYNRTEIAKELGITESSTYRFFKKGE